MGKPLNNPLSLLFDYEKRGRDHVVDLSTEEDRREYWRSIAFRVGDVHLLLDEHEVTELLTVPGTARVPGTQRWIIGVANVRGELLPVIDFGDFLFAEPVQQTKQTRVLVVAWDEVRSGLMVDQVMGVKRLPVDTKKPAHTEGMSDVLKTVVGDCYEEEQIFHVMSVKKLIEDTGFMQAAV